MIEAGQAESSGFAAALARAHLEGGLVAATAEQAPVDAAGAYRVQAEVATALGERAVGWKVALTPHGPAAAPVLERCLSRSGDRGAPPATPLTAVEVEFAFVLGDAPDRIEAAYLGVELIGPRLASPEAAPFPAFLADNLGNAGYVLGEEVEDPHRLLARGAICRVAIDDRLAFEGPVRHPNGDPLAPIAPCFPVLNAHPLGYAPGQFVTTGSLCGVVAAPGSRRIEVSVDGCAGLIRRFD